MWIAGFLDLKLALLLVVRLRISSMSIFTKPISQLSTADLKELLDEKTVENSRLEFKLEVPTKDETIKKLSSFANTFGGFMVIGARAASADGRIEDLPGVETQAGYKQNDNAVVLWRGQPAIDRRSV
ncbi:MAG: hypothetical protein JWO91_3761 [Acidobacteriaceae bacterium]|nr:hypothetical protein [Acidobacteriaceae bacterium]